MKINLNVKPKDLNEVEIEGSDTLCKFLANALVSQAEGDVMKHFEWAMKLNKGEVIDLDTSDQEYLQNFVKNHKGISILVKAQILKAFKK